MRVLVLGADGYLGWPVSMFFSNRDHDVIAVDNYSKRKAALELNCESLLPCPNLALRSKLWKELTGKQIAVHVGDVTDYAFLSRIFKQYSPHAVVHFAEQPSAPFSMIDRDRAAFTIQNNLISTLNIIHAVKEFSAACHIIKLGTMGEYGTPNIDIEEGWIDIEHKGRKDKFLFPRQASSLYHTTKIQDTDLLWFYVRNNSIRVTDLMQGPVYGISTHESVMNEGLMPHFHYDEIFGTVFNRFVVQAVAGYPLTVYGKGGQTRGYINIKDSLQCIYLSALNPAEPGELRVFNQITETFSVNSLAEKIQSVGSKRGYAVEINHISNPRKEKEEHYYNPAYKALRDMGLEAHYLNDQIIEEMISLVSKYKERINKELFFNGIAWA